MSTMADTITRQVSEQVKRAIEARPGLVPPLNTRWSLKGNPPTVRKGCRPFVLWSAAVRSRGQIGAIGFLPGGKGACGGRTRRPICTKDHRSLGNYLYLLHDTPQVDRLSRGARTDFSNERRELKQAHTTTECRELKKALHELADMGQIDRFLKRGLRFLR
ncbi:LOW QUALITY PROTEIN: hypothetical protein Cgig2_002209 [Carnegiea gigantea]|uniref:Uncharacterized protein n=1 Tax=Carnegiea gigantea TaxID=171969 RepID=A0A9Q1GT68_9CARY|nr:LOW QUALITY PROTEIN: hypothetical protein Cgig2_002209 [Carnegiea gigantea]